jgi:hypothetical protein
MLARGARANMVPAIQTEPDMKRPKETPSSLPQHDYGLALQTAVSWLGDRYLLAEPVTPLRKDPKPFFVEPRRWHDAHRPNGALVRKH